MTAILDYLINHNKAFAGMTAYEKWEYREDVIDGMKEKIGDVLAVIVAFALCVLLVILLAQ